MKKYKKADITELELEDIVRRSTESIEEGLLYVDHQKPTNGGRLDVLMVDSGKSLVIAELKVVQDDGMLLQGLDYYDYVTTHIESFARLYKNKSIDPTQQVRLFLIAPSFSQTLVNRCKWLDIPITLFTFNCLKFENENEIVSIFTELPISAPPEIIEVKHLNDHLTYITDTLVKAKVTELLEEIKNWKPGNIFLDAIKYAISMKVNGHVFAYLHPRRQHYLISTYNSDNEWTDYPITNDEDLQNVKPIIKAAMERRL
jgi:hypothetical protein